MLYLIILFLLFILFTFLGYAFHWAFHQKWMGPFYNAHLNHHTIQYPPEDFSSDKYRDAGTANSVWLFAIAFSPLGAILTWLVICSHISLLMGFAIAVEMIIIGWLYNNLHDSFHINETFWNRFSFFDRLKRLHYIHHIDMKINYSIFMFLWDRLFRTFKE